MKDLMAEYVGRGGGSMPSPGAPHFPHLRGSPIRKLLIPQGFMELPLHRCDG